MEGRSTNADDYQHVANAVTVMAKVYLPGQATPEHIHVRGQLLWAVRGVMAADLSGATAARWLVSPARALWIPPRLPHVVHARGRVEMRTVYVAAPEADAIGATPFLVEMGGLLPELILALLDEPVSYDVRGRGGDLARLILGELRLRPTLPLSLPMPRDPRARRAALAQTGMLAREASLDDWADAAGASRRTLSRLFRAETGLSFGEWRQRLLALEGLALLSEGSSVAAAARAVGYASPSAFTAMVKRVVG